MSKMKTQIDILKLQTVKAELEAANLSKEYWMEHVRILKEQDEINKIRAWDKDQQYVYEFCYRMVRMKSVEKDCKELGLDFDALKKQAEDAYGMTFPKLPPLMSANNEKGEQLEKDGEE